MSSYLEANQFVVGSNITSITSVNLFVFTHQTLGLLQSFVWEAQLYTDVNNVPGSALLTSFQKMNASITATGSFWSTYPIFEVVLTSPNPLPITAGETFFESVNLFFVAYILFLFLLILFFLCFC
jgi:hypothetical protein